MAALRAIGAEFHARGWSLGTSSNYSVRLSRQPLRLLITASGKDKSQLSDRDFVIVDAHGAVQQSLADNNKPSAETLLHVVAAARPDVGAVLHTHSVWATTLSDLYHRDGHLRLEGYEMLKGLEGIRTHEHQERLTIFENTQDISTLADQLRDRLEAEPDSLKYGFLLRRHGLYTWGRDIAEARRHVEIFEFLFEVVARSLMLKSAMTRH
ncbi:MAG TPA: methylthioribulose 1-phosphate dehydratase [Phycisphaerae bacterium]|nr:methylthioribulose 1-phosphate dehydratase [Phycisphaerae bacterium]